jgi:CRISPR-associated protein Cmr3
MPTHTLQLQPSDVLFFKDGRPMDGASSGQGAAWPLPNVLDAALHAALHRSGHASHSHTSKRSGAELDRERNNSFGSLQTASPFPVSPEGSWYFPRPADADELGSSSTTHHPLNNLPSGCSSSLSKGLMPVINSRPPSKEKAEPWLSKDAYQAYLNGYTFSDKAHFLRDQDIYAAEHNIGIAIEPDKGTTIDGAFYSASYLRLKNNWHIGMIASCMDKGEQGNKPDNDLIAKTFLNSGHINHIIAGGQQRTCSVLRSSPESLPFPIGPEISGNLVRWTLLTPAIFPEITGKNTHTGGWLPTWINPDTHQDPFEVMLLDGPGKNAAQRRKVAEGKRIEAKLVAAMITRPIAVTGWSLGHSHSEFGAKSIHLAVPAGSVYYFQCVDNLAAKKLAHALNWHGDTPGTEIKNRRSTILGEKGFGIGVCSPWSPKSI